MERDTDRDWKAIGEINPYFGVVGDPRYHRERINDRLLNELYRGGETEIQSIIGTIRDNIPDLTVASALDFGCGVGRHSLALAQHATRVTAFDIAPGMTALAEAAASKRGVTNCQFVNFLPQDERFDWINSYQVFQHIPPERGYGIVDDLFQKMAFGGVCSLQFTLFRDNRHVPSPRGSLWRFDGKLADALTFMSTEGVGQIILFDYDLNHLLAQMVHRYIDLLGITMTERGGHYGAWIFGQKRVDALLIQPNARYEAAGPASFAEFLGNGWSALEDWGVWSSGRAAIINARIDPTLQESHVLKLHGKAFVNSQHPLIEIAVHVNSTLAATARIIHPKNDQVLEISLRGVKPDGTVVVSLTIDEPMSPAACGLPTDDTRELGFGLEAVTLEPAGTKA